MDIGIEGLHKRFGTFPALRGVDLRIPSGQLLALLGPSGSGKTTLLRTLAGLEEPDSGRILFGERDATRLSLRERRVGLVFQHYALFPHLSVFENVAFGLRSRRRRERPAKADLQRRVLELLERMQIGELRERLPDQLSGGQKQRVALARAMAIEPSVLLLDEPFGALDAKVRIELRRWLRHIHEQTGYTTVFVTHDQEEALELADRVVVMRDGRIQQDGTPEQVYAEPANAFVYDFLGRSNRIAGQVRDGVFHVDGCDVRFACEHGADGPAQMYARPHDIALTAAGDGIAARVVDARQLAGRNMLMLELPQQARSLEIDVGNGTQHALPAAGELVAVRPSRYRVFADTNVDDAKRG
ncbi:MAG TPA: sulfate/molybdate ABC transporter ATP-binding protein [Xanthomonadaceae bacterium]|nr:sulfate/molybdate ABC transporter ATP-binding protein [Xanthomonadaceae bacterium]